MFSLLLGASAVALGAYWLVRNGPAISEGFIAAANWVRDAMMSEGQAAIALPTNLPGMPVPDAGSGSAVAEAAQKAEEYGSGSEPDKLCQECMECVPEQFFYDGILAHEGGFVDHPDDPGGATNKGVILDTWKRWAMPLFGISPSVETLKQITDDQAYKIFLEGYWKRSLADELHDCPFAFQFVDFYYNAPQGSAVVLQRSINALGGSVREDWKMGRNTLDAANEIIDAGRAPELYRMFRQKRIDYYNHRADTVERADTFRKGWLRRARSFTHY